MRVESRARARALQAIYAWDMRGERDLERVSTQIFDDLLVSTEERKIASLLLRTLLSDGKDLDKLLAEVTTNWRIERLGAIDRSVLRLAAAELRRGETPPRVIIREAIRLAERYGTVASARFVNGVLDALARKMGRL
jgi:transcription antitermination protein NusB